MIIHKKQKILFICPYFSPFIQKDLDLLRRHFDVKVGHYTGLGSIPKILKAVLWSDITFSWFADIHAFWAVLFSKIFNKKSIVVVGGYEVAKVPEINYGLMLNPKSARRVKYVLENADKVLAVSEFNKREILKCMNEKENEKVKLIYHGVDYNKFTSQGEKKDNRLVISVGYVKNSNLKRKGLETFVRAAKFLPNVEFVLIGKHIDDSIRYLKSIAPVNVKFTGFVSEDDLLKYYQRAKVYVQVSAHEGFGLSLAEAMLCECVPVVTNKGAIPEVVGDAGFYVPYGNPKATAEAIKEALNTDKGKEARERIKKMFPIERREKELIGIINSLVRWSK